jgi:DNA-binding response OmpR family regulator
MTTKILVIDDEPAILELMRAIFESAGYAVETTDTADAVAQLTDGELPHVIILDLLLAGKDGRDTIRQLKSQERTRQIPVLMLSAHHGAESEALATGADDFLAKPFEIEELLAKVTSYGSAFGLSRSFESQQAGTGHDEEQEKTGDHSKKERTSQT